MSELVSFVGTVGNGANINLDVPMPGTHTGRRIIVIGDISDDAWNNFAKEAGAPWTDTLGVKLIDGSFTIDDISKFTAVWKSRQASIKIPDYDDDVVEIAMLEVQRDASEFNKNHGSLRTWIKDSPLLGSEATFPAGKASGSTATDAKAESAGGPIKSVVTALS